ncbi:MAG TPA: ammonia-forming cytochrome c nitrite reductase subunit c552 [Spirochaetota bacterium]|nr:ammonia-forming cytochrome c nitrite reductase subunit c552 [Spirochaetota bacterium]
MTKRTIAVCVICGVFGVTGVVLLANGCAPSRPELVKVASIPDGEYDPAEWGKAYPLEYESWAKTKEPRPTGKSKYKPGLDTDKIVYDKLSEFPFMALLFHGWGFGVEYNEPQGHWYMRIDQDIIDQSRTKAGGVCLNCKSPYMDALVKEHGPGFYSMPWQEAVTKIPAKHKDLGAACIDCHDNRTMDLKINRAAFSKGLAKLGKKEFTRQEMRTLVCAQCHVTYNVPKDQNMKSLGVDHPYDGSTWGTITIENIIAVIKRTPAYKEWTQAVTGLKVGFLRHPEFEFFTRASVHWNAGLSCADCHMPYQKSGANKISNHNLMSPLKDDLRACVKCHPQGAERLKRQVIETQDRTVSLLLRAGYGTATAAKLIELANAAPRQGKTVDQGLYAQAVDFYLEALYRVIFIGAENSLGFHNPMEAGRILGDAIAFSAKSEALLRQLLAAAGVTVPTNIMLDLTKYINNRGTHRKNFRKEFEFADPFGIQERILPRAARGI